jgi:hypothetical protein
MRSALGVLTSVLPDMAETCSIMIMHIYCNILIVLITSYAYNDHCVVD